MRTRSTKNIRSRSGRALKDGLTPLQRVLRLLTHVLRFRQCGEVPPLPYHASMAMLDPANRTNPSQFSMHEKTLGLYSLRKAVPCRYCIVSFPNTIPMPGAPTSTSTASSLDNCCEIAGKAGAEGQRYTFTPIAGGTTGTCELFSGVPSVPKTDPAKVSGFSNHYYPAEGRCVMYTNITGSAPHPTKKSGPAPVDKVLHGLMCP